MVTFFKYEKHETKEGHRISTVRMHQPLLMTLLEINLWHKESIDINE